MACSNEQPYAFTGQLCLLISKSSSLHLGVWPEQLCGGWCCHLWRCKGLGKNKFRGRNQEFWLLERELAWQHYWIIGRLYSSRLSAHQLSMPFIIFYINTSAILKAIFGRHGAMLLRSPFGEGLVPRCKESAISFRVHLSFHTGHALFGASSANDWQVW